MQTPLIIDPEMSQVEDQKYKPKRLKKRILVQAFYSLTECAWLKRDRRSDCSDVILLDVVRKISQKQQLLKKSENI